MASWREKAGRLLSSRFLRDVGAMSAGAIAAQVISVLSMPVLTRLYTPAEFGLYGLFFLSPCWSARW